MVALGMLAAGPVVPSMASVVVSRIVALLGEMGPGHRARGGHRDATLIMVAYRHGLRAKEACELEWSQVEFGRSAALHVRRAKQGKPAVHPIRGDELRMLTALRKAQPDSGYVFTSERGTPFTPDAM